VHVPGLDPVWERVILRLLEREPEARFASARAVVHALESGSVPEAPGAATSARRPSRPGRGRMLVSAALVAGGLVAGLMASRLGDPSPATPLPVAAQAPVPPPPPGPPGAPVDPRELAELAGRVRVLDEFARQGKTWVYAFGPRAAECDERSVAVIGFRNTSGARDVEWISAALSEMLATELAVDDHMRPVPAESVARMKRELELPNAESYAGDTLARIRDNVCARYVLVGSYLAQPGGDGQLRLDLRLQSTMTGETIAQVAETGRQSELIDLVARAGVRLRGAIGGETGAGAGGPAVADGGGPSPAVRTVLPQNPTAARLYAEGMIKLRREECADAQELLERAVASDPRFAMARAALSEALWCVGYEEAGRAEARRALELADALPRRERLLVQAGSWTIIGELDKALDAYQTLFEFYPGDLQIGLDLARTQLDLGKHAEFRATVAALRKLPRPDSEHPRIDLFEAKLAGVEGDVTGERAALERAVARADARGARLMSGAALMTLAGMYLEDGEIDRAAEAAAKIHEIGVAYGDRELEAVGLDISAMCLAFHGRLRDAEALLEQALVVVKKVGIERRRPQVMRHIAMVQIWQGRLGAAEKTLAALERSRQERREKDASFKRREDGKPIYARLLEAKVAWLRGDLDRADALLAELLKAVRESKRPAGGVPEILVQQALVARDRGDLKGALRLLDEARTLTKGQTKGQGSLQALGAETERARILLESGDAQGALALAHETAELAHAAGLLDHEARARATEALALVALGKQGEAERAIAPAVAWAASSQNVLTLVAVGMADAAILGGGDAEKRELAQRRLALVVEVARRAGMTGIELEASLALGQSELQAGQVTSGRARLTRVEKVARQRGLDALARRAASYLS
jgi:tetratricopeptide (TPR) repeat protein/TolB-like protein